MDSNVLVYTNSFANCVRWAYNNSNDKVKYLSLNKRMDNTLKHDNGKKNLMLKWTLNTPTIHLSIIRILENLSEAKLPLYR